MKSQKWNWEWQSEKWNEIECLVITNDDDESELTKAHKLLHFVSGLSAQLHHRSNRNIVHFENLQMYVATSSVSIPEKTENCESPSRDHSLWNVIKWNSRMQQHQDWSSEWDGNKNSIQNT